MRRLYNKENLENVAQMLLTTDNPDIILIQAQLALVEANIGIYNSCAHIIDLRKRLELLPTDSEAGIIIGGGPQPKNSGKKIETNNTSSGAEVAARRMGQDGRRGEVLPQEDGRRSPTGQPIGE
jgi:hypothetical protein